VAAEGTVVIVGGGFYGARLALQLRAARRRVLLVEREASLLARASLRNQARVHNGYHYPRSLLTSLRSRQNYTRFLAEYADCVDQSFPHYYAVGKRMSKITAAQFAEFCRRIAAPIAPAPPSVAALFDSALIDAVFEVQECAFDAAKLRTRLERELDIAGVDIAYRTEALRLDDATPGVRVMLRDATRSWTVDADLVINATYSSLNRLLAESGAPIVPAKHELTEMALIEPPPALGGAAVTVMDGPFFSMMPYPSRGLFTLSHVRYTPHAFWHDRPTEPVHNSQGLLFGRESRFMHMVRDAERYLPAMRASRYVDSLWEVKTVMPRSEQDDSRPILLQRSDRFPACFTVLGAKIDSVYDVEHALAGALGLARAPTPLSIPTVRA
jgi:glycine/D-amino acid oxidase-like deaminating enzyme